MSLEWILFGLRVLATVILTLFLAVAFYLIWRQLRQTEAQQTTPSTPKTDHLRVLSAAAGQSLVAGQTLPLQLPLVLGCGSEKAVIINPANMMPGQVRLNRRDDQWWLENLGQPEQIKLNNVFLSEAQPLSDGDVISMGDTQFCFEVGK